MTRHVSSAAEKYETMLRIAEAASSHSARETLFDAVAHVLKGGFPFDCTAVTLYDADRDVFQVTAIAPFSSTVEFSTGFELPRDGSHSGWAFDHGETVVAHDLEAEQRFATDETFRQQGFRSYVVTPLVTRGGDAIGTFNLGSAQPNHYVASDLAFLKLVATQIAMAVDSVNGHEALVRREAELLAAQDAHTTKGHAFQELLNHIEAERKDFRHQLGHQLQRAILPLLDSLKQEVDVGHIARLESMEARLDTILSHEMDDFSRRFGTLTPRERQISQLIRAGLTSKEIADRLHVAPVTVQTHRENIRKKLGIAHTGVNLGTYLQDVDLARSQ